MANSGKLFKFRQHVLLDNVFFLLVMSFTISDILLYSVEADLLDCRLKIFVNVERINDLYL